MKRATPKKGFSAAHNAHLRPRLASGFIFVLCLATIFIAVWTAWAALGERRNGESWQLPIAYNVLLTVLKVVSEDTIAWAT